MPKVAFFFLVIFGCSVVRGEAPPHMRTRLLTSLTNAEIEHYLKRNDVIFIPVGTVEPHAGLPIDCEYVGPLAYAIKLAEKADGLVLPGLVYFFPDATVVGRGAVHVTPSDGTAYLKAIAHSLLRQGFRRQIYITGHGPSFETVAPLVREFYDETHVPIVYLESLRPRSTGNTPAPPASSQPVPGRALQGNKRMFGAYEIVGRINDIPLNLTEPMPVHPADPGIDNLFPLGPQSGTIGFYMSDAIDHQGAAIPVTAEQRDQMTKEGVAQIDEEVNNFDINGILQAMRDHDKFTQENIVPKYGWMFTGK